MKNLFDKEIELTDSDMQDYSQALFLPDEDGNPYQENKETYEDEVFPIEDIDFSMATGKSFKESFGRIKSHIKKRNFKRNKRIENIRKNDSVNTKDIRYTKHFGVGNAQSARFKNEATIFGKKSNNIRDIKIPKDRKTIVNGVSNFILSQKHSADSIKNIGYYKGKKLKKLLLTFNNNTALPFNLELFNPSMPLDYLYATSLNLNDKIQVGGNMSDISYSDVLFYLLANPTHIVNATFVFSGTALQQQISNPLIFKSKNTAGEEYIDPQLMQLNLDNMQVANDIVYFEVSKKLNRPFIPDGMDVIKYEVLPFMFITMCFYYEQKSLKRFFYEEARNNKKII